MTHINKQNMQESDFFYKHKSSTIPFQVSARQYFPENTESEF